jgi:hypothetical protein
MADADHTTGSNPAPPVPLNPWPDTPERLIADLPRPPYNNAPLDLVCCALLRAHAVTVLLFSEFSEEDRNVLGDELIVNALWDIQGHLETAQHLIRQWGVANAHV